VNEEKNPDLGEVAAHAADTRMSGDSERHDFRSHGDGEVDVERATKSGKPQAEQDPDLESTFQASVEEGTLRVRRTLPTLLATGLVGGVDVSIGVVALLIVEHETGSKLLGALAFTIGFIALTLARSELFTENFLVPVAAVIARQARIREVIRLWLGTGIMNLFGGWVVIGLLAVGEPEIGVTADLITAPLMEQGVGWQSLALAIVGGAVITVMTWMERNCDTQGPQVVAAVAAGFVLAAVPLNHVIVNSLEMFAALHTGAGFGYLDYARLASWWALGNMIGGLLLVTLVRLVQVGRGPIEQARRTPFRRLHPGDPSELQQR
jgi:formate/nitrite transporter FocA (FNT family)